MPVNRDASSYIKQKAAISSAVADLFANATKPKGTIGNNITKPVVFVPEPPPPFIFRDEQFPNKVIVAGVLNDGNSSVNGIGTSAKFNSIVSSFRIDNIIYVVDRAFFNIRKFNIITTEVSTYISANAALNPTITTSLLNYPSSIAYDSRQNIMYIGQKTNILKVDMNNNTISELISLSPISTTCVSIIYEDNNLYYADPSQSVIYRVNLLNNNALTLLAGTKNSSGYENSINGATAKFNIGNTYDSCLTMDTARNLYLADVNNKAIRKINIDTSRVSTFLTLSDFTKIIYYDKTENSLYYSESSYIKKISMKNPFYFIPTMDTVGSLEDLGGFIVVNRNLIYLTSGRSVIYKIY